MATGATGTVGGRSTTVRAAATRAASSASLAASIATIHTTASQLILCLGLASDFVRCSAVMYGLKHVVQAMDGVELLWFYLGLGTHVRLHVEALAFTLTYRDALKDWRWRR